MAKEASKTNRTSKQTKSGSKRANVPSRPPQSTSVEEQKELFLQELYKTLGCALGACRKTGIDRATCERWHQDDAEFAERVRLIAEDALDFVESRMLEEIQSGNARLIQFYLEKKGRSRGYGKEERREQTGSIAILTQEEAEY